MSSAEVHSAKTAPGNAVNSASPKPRLPTMDGISSTPISPSHGQVPRKSKGTTKTFSKSKRPFVNSRATSKLAPSSIRSPKASSTIRAFDPRLLNQRPPRPPLAPVWRKPAKSPASCANSKQSASAGSRCGISPKEIYLNEQNFTKTSHCWGIENNKAGTNTNRIVVFQK